MLYPAARKVARPEIERVINEFATSLAGKTMLHASERKSLQSDIEKAVDKRAEAQAMVMEQDRVIAALRAKLDAL